MSDIVSMLDQADRLCSQVAIALKQSELQIYITLGLIVLLSVLLFPPRDDADQL
jgi:hypothetical protein